MKSTTASSIFNSLVVVALAFSPFLRAYPHDSDYYSYPQVISRSARSNFSNSQIQSLRIAQLVTPESEYCDDQEDNSNGELNPGFLFAATPIDPFETPLSKHVEIGHLRTQRERGPPGSTS
jgi:hypothetical protein